MFRGKLDGKELYYRIKEQRQGIKAPVDFYGCSSTKEQDEKKRKFKILVFLLLSSQTKDEVTYSAVQRLEQKLGEDLSIEGVRKQDAEFLDSCICKVGFHAKKSLYLKKIADIIAVNGLPAEMEEVLSLPGIDRKMAILYLYHACGKVEGVSVDTHVHRIANRIGLVDTKSPEQTRRKLESTMPLDEWGDINRTLVGFGQVICRSIKPRCTDCDIKSCCKSAKVYEF